MSLNLKHAKGQVPNNGCCVKIKSETRVVNKKVEKIMIIKMRSGF